MLILCCTGIGSAAFVVSIENSGESIINSGGTPGYAVVARKISNETNATWVDYYSIEDALSNDNASSGDTVIVVPGSKAAIHENVTIPDGVTLAIPIADSNISITSENGNNDKAYLANNDTLNCTQFVNELTLKEGVSLTLSKNAKIVVYGQLASGKGGGAYCGQPSGQVAALHMEARSSIVCESGSSITAYGIITDARTDSTETQGIITMKNGSTIKAPYVVRDFKGGTITTAIYKETHGLSFMGYNYEPDTQIYQSPFYQYQVLNIEPILQLNYGSKFTAVVNLYANSSTNSSTFSAVGIESQSTPSLLELTNEESFMLIDYDDTTEIRDIKIYGGARMNSMTISISVLGKTVSVDSSTFYYPHSWRERIYLIKGVNQESANFSIPQNYKCLPGSYFNIGEGCNLTIDGSLTIYDYGDHSPRQNPYFNDSGYASPQKEYFRYCVDKYKDTANKPSTFINDGNLIVNDGAAGIIQNTIAGATLLVNETAVITSYEATSDNGATIQIAKYQAEIQTKDAITNTLRGKTEGGSAVSTLLANVTYTSNTNQEWCSEVINSLDASVAGSITIPSDETSTTETLTIVVGGLENHVPSITISDKNGNAVSGLAYDSNDLNAPIESTPTSRKYEVTLTAKQAGEYKIRVDCGDLNKTLDVSVTKDVGSSGGSCLVEGTLITMADGTKVPVEDINPGDMVMAFDHEQGKFVSAPVMLNAHKDEGYKTLTVTELLFDDGTNLKIAHNHALFSLTDMNYVTLDKDNAHEFVGDTFYSYENKEIKLVATRNYTDTVRVYVPFTKGHINCVANGLLTNPGVYANFLTSILTFKENMQVDIDARNKDIEQYGLFKYEDLSMYVNETMFNELNLQYLKIGIGKKMYTMDDVVKYLGLYKKYFE